MPLVIGLCISEAQQGPAKPITVKMVGKKLDTLQMKLDSLLLFLEENDARKK